MPRFQEQSTRPQGTAVYDLDIIKIKFVVVFHTVLRQKNAIAFLDTKTARNTDESIKASVYRKATHTDKFLHFNSHHPLQHKR